MAPFLRSAPGLILLTLLLTLAASLPVSFGFSRDTLSGASALAATAVLALGLVPALIVRNIYKEPLAAYGFRLPLITHRTLVVFAIALIGSMAPLMFFLDMPEFRAFYSLSGHSLFAVLLFLGPISLAYYLAEEFLFRGFLTFALFRHTGLWMFPIIAAVFGLLHVGKPSLEILYATGVSLLLSWLSLESKSFLPSAIIHFAIALLFTLAANLLYPAIAPGSFQF
jgi:membrane protease YdiL (CAAX protease family)